MWVIAQVGAAGVTGGFVSWAIAIVLIAAVIALVFLGLRQFGVTVPPFVIQAFWICAAAVIIIGAILFIARLAGWA